MTFCEGRSVYEFEWCTGATYEELKGYLQNSRLPEFKRLCRVSTSASRVSLEIVSGKLQYAAYSYRDNRWRSVYRHNSNLTEFCVEDAQTEDKLRECMVYQMTRQFRDTALGFYDEPPKKSEVLHSLREGDTVARLMELRYTVYPARVQQDEDWDGAVSVVCFEGDLLLPYKQCGGEQRLILKYATFVPHSKVEAATTKCNSWFDSVESLFSNIRWSTLRSKLNSLGGK